MRQDAVGRPEGQITALRELLDHLHIGSRRLRVAGQDDAISLVLGQAESPADPVCAGKLMRTCNAS